MTWLRRHTLVWLSQSPEAETDDDRVRAAAWHASGRPFIVTRRRDDGRDLGLGARPGRFFLDPSRRAQDQARENRDNRDDDEELDQGETRRSFQFSVFSFQSRAEERNTGGGAPFLNTEH